jgi:hypothetical protein
MQFSQNWSKTASFERGAQKNGKTRRATFFSSIVWEKWASENPNFSMGDVIREFKLGAKNGNIS